MKRNVPFMVQSFQVRVISDNNQVPLLLEKKLPQNLGFPGGSDGKESACNAGDPGSIPGSERSPEEGNDYPLQYSCLENSVDRRAWWATVHGVAKCWT